MASFTDSIPQFNPYVQQLPVEAMVQVGMQKQKQYDEGIQKIQTNIDNIAGLEVTRDVDKAYLQSKLNQLGNDLTTVAAGDFSNFQLVNSVNGMTNQIVRDPNVQNAVNSSAKRKKEYAFMEEARKKGELSPSNEYVFKLRDSDWVNSTELGKAYGASYTPYRDVKKKAMEAIKALHPKLSELDIPFVMDSQGNIDTSRIADAMIRQKIEGIDENQIKQAVYASLDAGDLNQLQIDGTYQFRGVSPEDLVNRAKLNYDNQRARAIEGLQYIDIQTKILADPTKIDELNKQKEAYMRLLGTDGREGSLDAEFYENVNDARENPEKVKYNIYRDGFVSELANAFNWKSVSKQYLTNPLKQQQNFERELRFKQLQEQRDVFEDNRDYQLKLKDLELKAAENAMKHAELYGTESPWYDLGNKTTLKNEAEAIYESNISELKGTLQSKVDQLNKRGYTDAEIKAAMEIVEDNQGRNDKRIKPELYKALTGEQGILKLENDIKAYEDLRTNIMAKAEAEAGVKTTIDAELTKRASQTFTLTDGEKVTLTPREMLGIAMAKKEQQVNTEYGTQKQTYYDTKNLTSKQKKVLASTVGSINIGKVDGKFYQAHSGSSGDQITKVLNSYNPIASKVGAKYEEANEIFKEKLADVSTELIPKFKSVSKTKEGKYPPITLSNVSAYLSSLQEMGLEKGKEYNATQSLTYLNEENIKDTDILIKNQGNKYQVWIKNKNNPDDVQKVDISEENLAKMTGGSSFISRNTDASRKLAAGKGNTNLNSNPERAEFQGSFGSFPNVRTLKITADLQDVGNGQFYYSINLKKKDGRYQQFDLAGPNNSSFVGYDQARVALANLTDKDILNQIRQEYPNYDLSNIDIVK